MAIGARTATATRHVVNQVVIYLNGLRLFDTEHRVVAVADAPAGKIIPSNRDVIDTPRSTGGADAKVPNHLQVLELEVMRIGERADSGA
jgi:hypothetical protein